jgi:Ca2+-binding EF-hand superfamily protein
MHATLGSASPGPNRVGLIFQELDTDNSRTISFEEFLTLVTDVKFQESGKDELRQTFDMFDKDHNGFICNSELKTVMDSLGRFQSCTGCPLISGLFFSQGKNSETKR